MNIKVGDKVRIKTWDELAVEGIVIDKRTIKLKDCELVIEIDEMGRVQEVVEVDESDNTFCNGLYWNPISAIAEVLYKNLDEYICSLPLEERAEKFVYDAFVDGATYWYSTIIPITDSDYLGFWTREEAIQATIEALKQPKE